jgi:hypothetical protein
MWGRGVKDVGRVVKGIEGRGTILATAQHRHMCNVAGTTDYSSVLVQSSSPSLNLIT